MRRRLFVTRSMSDTGACLAHVVSHDEPMTLQMERSWVHSNGITTADLERPGHYVTLLLDRILVGAANP